MDCLNNVTCGVGNKSGIILPLFDETGWNQNLRATLYCLGLLWIFLGVAIIADVFMCSIEKITSFTREIKVANPDAEEGYEVIEVKVWNDTVANLTLMALGSSAPEILLSCIEIVGNNFYSGALGPSTIVGSAAFNLLVITAVCIICIPAGEVRRIKHIKVFAVTAFFSVFAYLWLVIILMVSTPNYVELWEAIITFLFFPIMVILAYIADRDFCGKKDAGGEGKDTELGFELNGHGASIVESGDSHYIPWLKKRAYTLESARPRDDSRARGHADPTQMREIVKELQKIHPQLSEEEIAQLAAARISEDQQHSALWYRINATRKMGGGSKLNPTMNEDLQSVYSKMKAHEYGSEMGSDPELGGGTFGGGGEDLSEKKTRAVIEFTSAQSAVLEGEGRVKVGIRRYGKLSHRTIFKLETIDGTAEANSDYKPVKEIMVFEKDETYKSIDIEIIDDNEWEPDEVFFVKIVLDITDPNFSQNILGKKAIQEITIINDDEPGTFQFAKPSLLFKESAGKALIPVERSNGADGKVTITWKTEDMSAVSGKDFEGGEGTLVFEHGEMTKHIEIPIHDDQEIEKDECFKVDLLTIEPAGAKFGRIQKTIITLVNDDDFNGMISRLVDMTNVNMDALRVESTSWKDQFRNAMNVNGGDLEGANHIDYLMHFCTFFWKIFFALVPPVSIAGGWLTFWCALMMIAIVTTLVGDLASIFGCLIGLLDPVTAITFVALGTSLPDLFASKQAATQEKTADNSIGNVTGSNSVNVFLGLGLPWMIAAGVWTAKGDTFKVEAGSLGFSVIIYSICAVICIAMLMIRRNLKVFGNAELGGNVVGKWVCFGILVSLWVFYILVSSFEAYKILKVNI